jgi:hypothetical protein
MKTWNQLNIESREIYKGEEWTMKSRNIFWPEEEYNQRRLTDGIGNTTFLLFYIIGRTGYDIYVAYLTSNPWSLFISFTKTKLNSVAWFRERTVRRSDRRLSTTLVPTFVDRRYHVISVTDPYNRIPVFVDRSR